MTDQIKENLHHFFVGYTRNNPNIPELLTINTWKAHAQQELERRKVEIIKNFDINELHAIANGDIDLNQIIEDAYQSHAK